MVLESDIVALQYLTHLQVLSLRMISGGEWQAHTLDPLKHLTALTKLRLDVSNMCYQPMLLAPGLTA